MNLAQKLAEEIARVTKLREQYASLDGMPGVNVRPAILMMDAALAGAKGAAGVDDAVEQLRAVRDLEGFES